MANAPKGREKNVTGTAKPTGRRGDGLGTGPVGNSGGYSGRGGSTSSGGGKRSGGSNLLMIIIAAVVLLGGGGGGLSALLGGSSDSGSAYSSGSAYTSSSNTGSGSTSSSSSSSSSGTGSTMQNASATALSSDMLQALLGGSAFSGSSVSTGWSEDSNVGDLDETVESGARAKRTQIKGKGKDTVTIMVFMCGADLESRSGMATSDLQEMINATIGSNVNILVYTGGASKWKNSAVSNGTTQIYKVESGGIKRLEADMGNVSMTSPSTLTSFIKYCTKNYPANRNELIFWDHGGGSLSGYGYDEKFPSSGTMTLKGINEALKNSGTTFDFIGFDACLMATLENGLMLDSYADYLIASEETEPGVGWYYTNWITKLSANTSMPTIEIGKNIADDFVSVCAQKCPGQKTTLSVVDLAELSATVPSELNSFASATLDLLQSNGYKTVANARSGAREFASGTYIDQMDLISFANKLGTDEAKALNSALLGAIKYNKTSSNMTDAFGISIYFPYQKMSQVTSAVSQYSAIGMDTKYSECIQRYAGLQSGGQAVSGGSSSALYSLLGNNYTGYSTGSSSSGSSSYGSSSYGGSSYGGSSYGSSSYNTTDLISALLTEMLGGTSTGNVSGLTSSNSSFLGKSINPETDAQYLYENRFNPEQLVWVSSDEGPAIYLTEDQWGMVTNLELSLFLDDGEGYIDLGLDTTYSFGDDGGLLGTFEGTWLAINGQTVAYYHQDSVYDGDNYTITGYVPAFLNGERVNLIVVFDSENPKGYIAGAQIVYADTENSNIAKNLLEINDGDTIDFVCDYYTYENEYQDSYYLGEQLVVEGGLEISDMYLDDSLTPSAMYRFTDIYQQTYWTPAMQN